jgi:hypothetical protein
MSHLRQDAETEDQCTAGPFTVAFAEFFSRYCKIREFLKKTSLSTHLIESVIEIVLSFLTGSRQSYASVVFDTPIYPPRRSGWDITAAGSLLYACRREVNMSPPIREMLWLESLDNIPDFARNTFPSLAGTSDVEEITTELQTIIAIQIAKFETR